ncbi:restriction endonuclease subunit S [Sphingomonas sp. 1185]|uniref:restriction endonuclease subunit S n=1 Tax=Sphingomonas sp. 1185 TaxID=3156411 RepID=UPI003397E6C5
MTLPQGWVETTIGDTSEAIQYGLTCTSSRSGGSYRYIRITDIQNRKIDWNAVPFADVSSDQAAPYRVEKGDLLFARTGATVGKSYLVRDLEFDAAFASYLIKVRCDDRIISREFAASYFQSPRYWEQILDGSEGTGQPNFNGSKLAKLIIDLPPVSEQRRIVAKLDALTIRLARARGDLERVMILARRLRSEVLSRCLSEHEAATPLGDLLTGIEAGKNLRCEERPPRLGERGVVKVSAVTWGRFDAQQSKTLPHDYTPPDAAKIRAGDLLISRANTLELVGATVLVEEEPNELYLSDKILRLVMPDADKRWVMWFLRSQAGRREIELRATGNQLSMRNISQGALRDIPIPYPDADVRKAGVEMIEAAFARADRLEAEATRARALLDRLEAAILAKAFRGELVPQDPNDEPVSVLLDRIRAERAAAPKPKRGRACKAVS